MKHKGKRKAAALILTAMMLAGLFCGCGSFSFPFGSGEEENDADPEEGAEEAETASSGDSVFSLNYARDEGFDPYNCSNVYNLAVCSLLYEQLFELNESFEADPLLCDSFTTQDGIVWSFTLNKGVTFSDGSPCTSEDAVYSINQARAGDLYSERLSGIESVSSVSEYEFSVTLSAPNSSLPVLLSIPAVKRGTAGDAMPIGSGPYYVSEAGEYECLKANVNRTAPSSLPAERIYLKEYDSEELVYAFESGYIDLAPADLIGSGVLNFGGDYQIKLYGTTDMQYIGFNLNEGIFADKSLRRAACMVIDRQHIAAEIMSGFAKASVLPVNPSSACYDSALASEYAYSPERLAEQLSDFGAEDHDGDGYFDYYSGGSLVPLAADLIVNSENKYKLEAARYIASALEGAGFNVLVRELPWEEYILALEEGDFDIYYGEVLLTPDFDLSLILSPEGSLNYSGISDVTYKNLISSFLAAGSDRSVAAYTLYKYVCDNAPIAPVLFKEKAVISHWDTLSGLASTPGNVFAGVSGWIISIGKESQQG